MQVEQTSPQTQDVTPLAAHQTAAAATGMRLGPPFFTPWEFYHGPNPKGFTSTVSGDSYLGSMKITMAAAPHDLGAPLTIGWRWGGWRCQVFAPYAGARFEVVTFGTSIQVAENGGVWRAKCHISLMQGHRMVAEKIGSLHQGQICRVAVQAPYAGYFTLQQGTSVRAAYRGAANPSGTVNSRVLFVTAPFGARSFAATEKLAEAEAAQAGEGEMPFGVEIEEPTPQELAEEYAKLQEQLVVHPLGASEDERVAGMKVFAE